MATEVSFNIDKLKDEDNGLFSEVSNLHTSLRLQAAIRKRWGCRKSLSEITSLGLYGFVNYRIWELEESKLINYCKFVTVVNHFTIVHILPL